MTSTRKDGSSQNEKKRSELLMSCGSFLETTSVSRFYCPKMSTFPPNSPSEALVLQRRRTDGEQALVLRDLVVDPVVDSEEGLARDIGEVDQTGRLLQDVEEDVAVETEAMVTLTGIEIEVTDVYRRLDVVTVHLRVAEGGEEVVVVGKLLDPALERLPGGEGAGMIKKYLF